MKRAVILHGTDAEPMGGWRPWLKEKLEAEGYEAWIPSLPENHTPNREVYNDFLLSANWDLTGNIIVGHSSGAVAVLNLLMDERCPKIKCGVMVSSWNGKLINETQQDARQFRELFPQAGFNFELIKSKADKLLFIHNEFDPYCPPQDAEYLSKKLGADLIMLHKDESGNAAHLGWPMTELPGLWEYLAKVL